MHFRLSLFHIIALDSFADEWEWIYVVINTKREKQTVVNWCDSYDYDDSVWWKHLASLNMSSQQWQSGDIWISITLLISRRSRLG